ncbi:hypothetical protein BC831DRAFT_481604, partial [Entophlyctis helioformis]
MAVTQGHFLGLALYGTALWGSGAFAISLIPKTISDKRIGLPVIYAAIIPASAAMVAVIPKLVPGVGVLKGTAIAAAVAGLLDGFALAWAPKLYGQGDRGNIGAWLLWTYGWCFASAAMLA